MSLLLLTSGDINNTISSDAVPLPSGLTLATTATYRWHQCRCDMEPGHGDHIAMHLIRLIQIIKNHAQWPIQHHGNCVWPTTPILFDKDRNLMPMASFEDVLSDQRLGRAGSPVRLHLGDREEPSNPEHNVLRGVRERWSRRFTPEVTQSHLKCNEKSR